MKNASELMFFVNTAASNSRRPNADISMSLSATRGHNEEKTVASFASRFSSTER